MAFKKYSIAVTPPEEISEDKKKSMQEEDGWEVGQVHPEDNNLIWDGETWISQEEWKSRKVEE